MSGHEQERTAMAKTLFVSPESDHWGHTAPEIIEACERVAEVLIRAGYEKPRVITTVSETEALPSGSMFTDASGLGYSVEGQGTLRGYFGCGAPPDGWRFPDFSNFPFTVHYTPSN